ncbi:MAG: S8 family peptidase, partial [Planctomycetaceae bacterium]
PVQEPVGAAQPGRGLQWIVELTPEGRASATDVGTAARMLESQAAGARVVRGLGLQGSLLVQTQMGDFEATRAWLASQPGVARVSADAVVSVAAVPNDPSYGSLYGLENTGGTGMLLDADIDAERAWDVTTGSSSVVIGVIDTGIDMNHPDLAGNLWVNPFETAGDGIDNDANGFVDDIYGWDFANNDNNPFDDHGHGTHCAGTIGAVGNNGVGVVGVNWDVSLMALKFLGSNGSGSISNAALASNYATMMRERGVNVRATSNSWGGGPYDGGMESAIIAARDQGVLFVAAAGNSGVNTDSNANYPSNYAVSNVISVAATTSTDTLASFSNYGAATVDLGAPGVSILSTLPNNSYGYLSGTSMATPHVSGVVALAAAQFPDASFVEIRDAILAGGDLVASLAGKTVSGRRLNAPGTLEWLRQNRPSVPALPLYTTVTQSATNLQIGGAGVGVVVDNADDTPAAFNLGTDTFTFMGTSYTGSGSLWVSPNGLLSFGSGVSEYQNGNLSGAVTVPAIAVYWDDLLTNQTASDAVLAKRVDANGDGVFDQ